MQTEVDLGVPTTVSSRELWTLASYNFPSKIGGKPAWLDFRSVPDGPHLKCKSCGHVMIFLCQVYAPLDDDDSNFHRTIYVFVCRTKDCPLNIRIFRTALKRDNSFYSPEPISGELTDFHPGRALCSICGCGADLKCTVCQEVSCSNSHLEVHTRLWHQHQKTRNHLKSLLFKEFCLVIEPEVLDNNEDIKMKQRELEKFTKMPNKGTLQDVKVEDMDQFAAVDSDKVFSKFRKRIRSCPDQVLRYDRGGTALWATGTIEEHKKLEKVPKCEQCGAERQFEFQIMPQLLAVLHEDYLDWAVIAIFTCRKNCVPSEGGYMEEYVSIQQFK